MSRRPLALLVNPWLFGVLAILPIPVLLFSQHFPAWAPVAGLLWLAALFLLRFAATGRWLRQTPADLALLGLLLLLPLGLWAAPQHDVTLARSYAFVADVALFYAIAAQARNRALPWADWLLLLGGLAFIVAIVPATHFYGGTKLYFIDHAIYERIPSGFHLPGDKNGFNPNMAGGLLALFLPPALALSLRSEHWLQRLLAVITLLALAFVLLLMQSRGALLATLVAIAIVSGLLVRALRWLWWGGGLALLSILSVRGNLLTRFFAETDTDAVNSSVHSLAQRMELWSRAIYIGTDFPFTGIGLGSFPHVMANLYPTFNVTITADVPHAHNIYLQTLAEMGFPGLIFYLAFWGILLFILIRRVRRSQGRVHSLAAGLLGSMVIFLVHGIVDVPSYSPLSAIVIWGLFGMMMAVGLYEDRPEDRADTARGNKLI